MPYLMVKHGYMRYGDKKKKYGLWGVVEDEARRRKKDDTGYSSYSFMFSTCVC